MDNIILYEYGEDNKLYINLTNACTNKCKFCIRDYSGVGHDLWLNHQPSGEDVIAAFKEKGISWYSEFIFCGYGEPLLNFDAFITAAKYLRENTNAKIRLNTNGQSQLFLKKDITPQLKGLLDVISISLNAQNAQKYVELCEPVFGEESFDAILEFTKKCKNYVPKVIMSVVDTFITEQDIEQCRKIAESIQVEFRVREFSE